MTVFLEDNWTVLFVVLVVSIQGTHMTEVKEFTQNLGTSSTSTSTSSRNVTSTSLLILTVLLLVSSQTPQAPHAYYY
eukprot:3318943-Rhodomonas_salina.2